MADEPTTTIDPAASPASTDDSEFTAEDIATLLELPQVQEHIAQRIEAARAEVRTEIEAEIEAEEARGEKHGAAFAEVAKKLGIRPDALDDVLKLGEFNMEGDEPDPKAIEAECLKVLEGRDYLKAPGEPAPKQRLSADPHGNRGPSQAPKPRVITSAQLNNLDFMAANKGTLGKPGEDWVLEDD
jgi:hypothetical protein